MKRVLAFMLAVIITLCSFSFNVKPAYADALFARITTENTPFYPTESSTQPLFYLPYTYYVKVLRSGEQFTHVECYGDGDTAAIDGFVPTEMLFFDGLSVQNPFVVLQLTTVNTAVLYEDAALTKQTQYIFENRKLNYYGFVETSSGKAYFVSYNDRLGYIKETDVYPFSIPNHPNELTFLTPEVPETPPIENSPQQSGSDFFGLKVAIIICILFAGVVALFFALSKRPDKKIAATYYDDNEYE